MAGYTIRIADDVGDMMYRMEINTTDTQFLKNLMDFLTMNRYAFAMYEEREE